VPFALAVAFLGFGCDSGDGGGGGGSSQDIINNLFEDKCEGTKYSKVCAGVCAWDHSCLYDCDTGTAQCYDDNNCTEQLACYLHQHTGTLGECGSGSLDDVFVDLAVCSISFEGSPYKSQPETLAGALDYCAEEVVACNDWVDEQRSPEPEIYWDLVKIVDDPANTVASCGAGSPGADIDGVEFCRDGTQFGVVEAVDDVIDDIWSQWWPCDNAENLHDDILTLAGYPGAGTYFSLNGRTIVLRLTDSLVNGDELVVYEVFDAQNPDELPENYKVFLGYYDEEFDTHYMEEPIIDSAGMVFVTVDGLW